MKIGLFRILFLGTLLFWSCQTFLQQKPDTIVRTPDEQLVWISILYSGGHQCDPDDTYVPPDIERVLSNSDIAVFDTEIEPYMVCAACWVCPKYAAMHYALIARDNLEKAQQLGFGEKNPPQRDQ